MRRRARLGLIAAILLLATPFGAAPVGWPAVLVGRYLWKGSDPDFGGFSGIDLEADGLGFTAVSDRGTIRQGRLVRDTSGAVTGVEAGPAIRLKDSKGQDLHGVLSDSEGVALKPDGTVCISFEGYHRVACYPKPGGPSEPLPRPKAFDGLQNNSSFESLAIGPDGTFYTMPERSGLLERPFPVWRFRNGRWDQPFSVPRDGDWLPVGSDFGPDGRFYLLERDFRWLLGFRSRVRSFALDPSGFTDARVVLETETGAFDNLEGIALWRDAAGAVRMTLVSDDNFLGLLRTELVDFRLAE